MTTRQPRIDARTALYAIIGRPVRHSLSPVMHNAAFGKTGIKAVYLAFETDDVKGACRAMRALGIKGYSVTIPNKERITKEIDEPDESVRRIGACNTVKNTHGLLLGTNTDWLGAVMALEKKMAISGKRAVVLGAGGSARAVVFGLKEKGMHVTICNRTLKKAQILAREFDCDAAELSEAEALHAEILVNTTSVGMGDLKDKSPVSKKGVLNYQLVMDIVYSPLETLLLRYAREAGKMVINGLEMLLFQACAQFEYWTGVEAPEKTMREALQNAIK